MKTATIALTAVAVAAINAANSAGGGFRGPRRLQT